MSWELRVEESVGWGDHFRLLIAEPSQSRSLSADEGADFVKEAEAGIVERVRAEKSIDGVIVRARSVTHGAQIEWPNLAPRTFARLMGDILEARLPIWEELDGLGVRAAIYCDLAAVAAEFRAASDKLARELPQLSEGSQGRHLLERFSHHIGAPFERAKDSLVPMAIVVAGRTPPPSSAPRRLIDPPEGHASA